jgi:ATP-dependent protease HslVU (ClpYQ) peptidase subunit
MACDLQFTQSNGLKVKAKTKIYKFHATPGVYEESDFLVGFAGTSGSIIQVMHFFADPVNFKPPRVRDLQGLVLTEKGQIFSFFADYTNWLEVNEPFGVIGTGGSFALGAMHAGCDPYEAVKIAAAHDAYTGMGFKRLKF